MPQLDRRDLLFLAALALTVRVAAVLLWTPEPSGDATDYLRLAERLAGGDGFVNTAGERTSWRPPLYPAFLAPFVGLWPIGVSNRALTAVGIVQAVLSTTSVLLVYVIARTWFGRAVGIVSGTLTAISVVQVAAVSRMLSETLFVTLFLGALALLTVGTASGPGQATPRSQWSPALTQFLAGVCFGLSALVRSVVFPLPLILAASTVGLALRRGAVEHRAARTRQALLMVTGFALILAPWAARNARVHGALVPVATQMGETLYAGNHPTEGYILGVLANDGRTQAARAMTEVEASRYLTGMTVQDWTRHPAAVPRLVVLKLLYFLTPADWELLPGSGAFNPTYAFIAVWAGLAAALALLPLVRAGAGKPSNGSSDESARLPGAWTVWAPVVYFLVVAVVFYGSPRLRMPAEPLLSVVAAVGLIQTHRAIGRRRSTFAVAFSALFVIVLGSSWPVVEAVLRSRVMTLGVV